MKKAIFDIMNFSPAEEAAIKFFTTKLLKIHEDALIIFLDIITNFNQLRASPKVRDSLSNPLKLIHQVLCVSVFAYIIVSFYKVKLNNKQRWLLT